MPQGLPRGSYLLVACARRGGDTGALGCVTARRHFDVGEPHAARAAAARTAPVSSSDVSCSSGAHTLSQAGDHIYPEMGNGGYTSLHTSVNLLYSAEENEFLPGTNVVLTDRATQCLTDFSLDFERKSPEFVEEGEEGEPDLVVPGTDLEVENVTVNGVDAQFEFVQPTYPGDPEGQDDANPAAHVAGVDALVGGNINLPPACTPNREDPGGDTTAGEAGEGDQCPANKLVIKPVNPIQTGETFDVEVVYSGHPGVHSDADASAEGWFPSETPLGDGGFVTTEPVGSEAWMPLNNHPSAKPTYDFNETVTRGRTVVANGELVAFTPFNEPDANFPEGSTTWRWHSPEPIASYLVENSIGDFDLSQRLAGDGTLYYEVQAKAIADDQKALNKAIMDQHEDITHFQERFAGPYPFTTDGVVIGLPEASFEEEMQGKITFPGGEINLSTFNHENFHQWFGDNVTESNFNETFFKEGLARLSQYLRNARAAAEGSGGLDTPAGEAAFEDSLAAQFNTNYGYESTEQDNRDARGIWTVAPSNPTALTLFKRTTTYNRPATAYIALRQILGKDNFVNALKQIERDFGGGTIEQSQLEGVFQGWLPNPTPACHARLNTFFTEWFDTKYPATGEPTAIKPQLTGPGLNPSASGTTFYGGDCQQSPTTVSPPDTVAPEISDFRLAPARFKATRKGGSRFRFQLSEPAGVKIEIQRTVSGRKVGKRCVATTPEVAGHRHCTLVRRMGAIDLSNRPAGANAIRFTGIVRKRTLVPGSYRATITATDPAGNRSIPRRAGFTVLPSR